MANNVDIALRAKDEASKAFQSATGRLQELRAEIDRLQAKGPVGITVADAKNLQRLTSEANRLERALTTTGTVGTKAAQDMTNSFGGLGNLMSGLGLGGAVGAAGLAGIAAVAVKGAISLEQMREESAQLEARFVGFTGSAAAAEGAMRAFDQTVGNALTRDEKMAAAAQLLGLGLAQNAQDAANLTNEALILGIGMDTLTQALETGRVNGLVQYGISVNDVKRRAEELQAAQSSLTDVEAKQIAVKEQLAAKARAVAAAGGQAATDIEKLQKQWDTFKDAAADTVNLKVIIQQVTQTVGGATQELDFYVDTKAIADATAPAEARIAKIDERVAKLKSDLDTLSLPRNLRIADEAEIQRLTALRTELVAYGSGAEEVRRKREDLAAATQALAEAEVQYQTMQGFGPELAAEAQAARDAAAARVDAAQASLEATQAAQDQMSQWGDVGATAAKRAAEAAKTVKPAVDEVNGALDGSKGYWDRWAAYAEQASARAQLAASRAMGPQQGARSVEDWLAGQNEGIESRWSAMTQMAREQARGIGTGLFETSVKDWLEGQKDANTDAAAHFKTQLELAAEEARGKFVGYFSEGVNASINLGDVRGQGPFAPGQNGPFEDIYRLQDIAVNGPDKSQWDEFFATTKGLVVSQEWAKQVVADFQRGNITPDVEKFIDETKLAAILKGDQTGEKNTEAWAERMAKLANVTASEVLNKSGLGKTATATTQATEKIPATTNTTVNVTVAQGAVQVTSDDPAKVASGLVAEVFKAFQKAEATIGMPPPALAPGAR